MISKQTFIDIEPSPFKTCVYFVLVTLYLRWYAIPPCATLEKMMIAHTFRVEISSFPDPHQYGLSIRCNASYSEVEVRTTPTLAM